MMTPDGEEVDVLDAVERAWARARARDEEEPERAKARQFAAEREEEDRFARRYRDRGVEPDVDEHDLLWRPEQLARTQAIETISAGRAWREGRAKEIGGSIARPAWTCFVVGGKGVGKSLALKACVAHSGVTALYAEERNMLALPRNGYSTNEEAWERWGRVPLLAVDEIGRIFEHDRRASPDDKRERVFEVRSLIRLRHDRRLATILAGNVSMDDVALYLDASLADRLGEQTAKGAPWVTVCAGASMRGSVAG